MLHVTPLAENVPALKQMNALADTRTRYSKILSANAQTGCSPIPLVPIVHFVTHPEGPARVHLKQIDFPVMIMAMLPRKVNETIVNRDIIGILKNNNAVHVQLND